MNPPELTTAQRRLLRAAVVAGGVGVRLTGAAWLPASTLLDLGLITERRILLGRVDYRAAIATRAGRRAVELDDQVEGAERRARA